MQFEGFMAYSGAAAHTKTWDARRKRSGEDLAGVRDTVAIARRAGLPVNIVSGGFFCPNHGARFTNTGAWTGGQRTNNLHSYPVVYDAVAGTLTIG